MFNVSSSRRTKIKLTAYFSDDVRPNRISWNFDTWTKLWSGSSATTAERLETIQVSTFEYAPPHHNQALRDSANIERFIKERIRSWRMGKLTRFRSDISSMMKQILQKCESSRMECRPIEPHLIEQISEKFKQHKVIGFPLSLASQDQSTIEHVVKSTGIHKSNRSNVEFGLAVHIQPYPAEVQSCWVYLAQITPL